MSHSTITIEPNVRILVRDGKTGEVLEEIRVHNLVTDSGLNKIRDMLGYPAATCDGKTPEYCAVGTGSTAPASTQTTLVTEVYRSEIVRRVPDTKKLTFYHYLATTEGNGNTLREVGLFTESSSGLLWARATHAAIAKTSSISVTYEWEWSFSSNAPNNIAPSGIASTVALGSPTLT